MKRLTYGGGGDFCFFIRGCAAFLPKRHCNYSLQATLVITPGYNCRIYIGLRPLCRTALNAETNRGLTGWGGRDEAQTVGCGSTDGKL